MLSLFIQIFHAHGAGARDYRGESGQTEAALVEDDSIVCRESNLWIDDHVERYGLPIFVCKFMGRQILEQLLAILDHGKLQRKSDLRCSQPDAWSVPHGFLHVADQALDLVPQYFMAGQGTPGVPSNRVSSFAH